MQFDSENKNSKWYDAIKLEMESMIEYKVFKKWDKETQEGHTQFLLLLLTIFSYRQIRWIPPNLASCCHLCYASSVHPLDWPF